MAVRTARRSSMASYRSFRCWPSSSRLRGACAADCGTTKEWVSLSLQPQPLSLQALSLQPQPRQSKVGSAGHAAAPAAETLSSACLRRRVTFSAPEIDEAARTGA